PFDEERYKKVLHQCALEPDLELFQAGDRTEIGEKGLQFSFCTPYAGQGSCKISYRRLDVTLTFQQYSNASILLLDDVLAALEKVSFSPVHTAQWIVEKCFGGDLIQNRTVILVTHNIALTRPIANFVVSFRADGRLHSQGTISEITQRGRLAAQIHNDQQVLDKKQQEVDTEAPVADRKPAHGKLILAEEVELGHVSRSSLAMYFSAMGGKHPVFFFIFYFGGSFFYQSFVTLRSWQLGYWAKQYDDRPAEEVDVVFDHLLAICLYSVGFSHFLPFAIVFRKMHRFCSPFRWLDVTPASRIIVRVTNDVRAVDDSLAAQLSPLTNLIVSMLTKLGAVVIYAPIFFFPGAFVGALGAWVGQIYISGQLPVKRFMSNTRAPVLAHFGAAIAGLVSVRAFGAQTKFTAESLSRIDRYTRAARNFYNLNRWVSIRINILGATFSASVATYLVYITRSRAGDAGFVRLINDFEVQGTPDCLERIQGYINIEHEKPATEAGKPPAYWPASGDLRVENLSARYSEDGPKVLHDLSFHVKAGQRIGIGEEPCIIAKLMSHVMQWGRTGSGKSSLTLALLGCIPTEGSVRYDGLETSELNLDALRSSITIIPQVPELLSGSLRANLDPFGQYDDAELNYALRAAGLFALQNEMAEGRITLDSAISEGGSNLSVGQRQIFALARAIVRKSKILILDEDYKTDSIIQNSLREELRGDVSLLTVAHRLQTIMDADKVVRGYSAAERLLIANVTQMVLDPGRLVEFDSPKELLKTKDGKLRALVEESDDRDALYAMAGAE
ncbi:P-loop containing nucleoside triphosphate hydrolase protein, partial [Mycena sanguinolenta]